MGCCGLTAAATDSRGAVTASRSVRGRAFSSTRAASPGEHTPRQSHSVIVRHFEVPGASPRLRDRRNALPHDRASLDVQHRRISNLGQSRDLAGRIYLQIQNDRLRPPSAAASPQVRDDQ
jgi:hypothetical protein